MALSEPTRAPGPALSDALRAYEWGRLRWAMGSALPVLVLPVLSWALSRRTFSMAFIGASLFAAAAVFLWRGQALGRSVGLGVAAGLAPLALSHAARLYGHVCTGSGCISLCVPACSVGGVIAGVLVSSVAHRSRWPTSTLGSAAGVAFLTGALGCACVGYGGVIGLALGMGLTLFVARTLAWMRA